MPCQALLHALLAPQASLMQQDSSSAGNVSGAGMVKEDCMPLAGLQEAPRAGSRLLLLVLLLLLRWQL